MSELKEVMNVMQVSGERIPSGYYKKSEVDKVIAEKDKEIESLKASHYAEMVDAGMRERSLRMALWLARALRARDIQSWWIAATCSPRTEVACIRWNNIERKCLKKAEEYK